MKTILKKFVREEAGAVTVDWVVIVAAVAGLTLAIFAALQAPILAQIASWFV